MKQNSDVETPDNSGAGLDKGNTTQVAEAKWGFALPLVADSDSYPDIVIHDAKWRRVAAFPKTDDGRVRAAQLVNSVNVYETLTADRDALSKVSEAARDFIWEGENWESYEQSKRSDSVAWPPEFLLLAQAVEAKYGAIPLDQPCTCGAKTVATHDPICPDNPVYD